MVTTQHMAFTNMAQDENAVQNTISGWLLEEYGGFSQIQQFLCLSSVLFCVIPEKQNLTLCAGDRGHCQVNCCPPVMSAITRMEISQGRNL